ncbi:hypothetical protein SELMODRAFT_417519 [Selaginella moellendorffii]|uniref:Uncharacterized protein n=1 Tax=Selaginella moellendorffii TaxID=88036 RepID=D8S2H8_SELML|nr:hypothetical protein SELMODRAFT_417519 [Selaginella moellendorffii]
MDVENLYTCICQRHKLEHLLPSTCGAVLAISMLFCVCLLYFHPQVLRFSNLLDSVVVPQMLEVLGVLLPYEYLLWHGRDPAVKMKTGFCHKSVEINHLFAYSSSPTVSRNLHLAII